MNAPSVPAFSFTASAASVTVGKVAALALSIAAQCPDCSSIFFVLRPTPASGSHRTIESFCCNTASASIGASALSGFIASTTFHEATFIDSAVRPSAAARSV